MIRTPSKKVALLSTSQAFQYDMPVRERFGPTGYVQGTFDIEEFERTKETSKTLTGTRKRTGAGDSVSSQAASALRFVSLVYRNREK